jgi:cell division protein FtsA
VLVGHDIVASGYRNVIASGAVITGGTSLMPGADDVAAEILQLPVRVGFPESITGLTDIVNSPMHATGVGLLRYALSNAQLRHSPALSADHTLLNRMSRRMKEWVQDFF